MRRILKLGSLLVVFVVGFITLISCAVAEDIVDDITGGITTPSYSLTFNVTGGSSIDTKTVKAGTSVSKPADPTDPVNIFINWYETASYDVVVNWPLIINADKTVYARMLDPNVWFAECKSNTLNASIPYEFSYTYDVSLFFGSVNGPSGIRTGVVSHIPNNQEADYLEHNQDTGIFFIDGQEYVIGQTDKKQTFKLNEKGKLTGITTENIGSNNSFYTTSFAKLLFDDSQIQYTASGNANTLNMTYNNKTAILSGFVGLLGSPLVNKFVPNIPELGTTLETSVTIANNKISTYHYNFSINVSSFKVSFSYDLTVTKVGTGVSITVPTFPNAAITQAAINQELNTINTSINNVLNTEVSGYKYNIKTAVNEGVSLSNPLGLAINSTSKGRTLRKVADENVYFWNRLEFDSDYKNGSTGLVDYELYRAKTLNGKVYDVKDGLLSNPSIELADYGNEGIDEYYGFILKSIIAPNSPYVTLIAKSTANNKTTYSVSLSTEGVKLLLEYYDEVIRVNGGTISTAGTGTNLQEVDIYKILSSFTVKSFSLEFTVNNINSTIEQIELSTKGSYIQADSNDLVDYKLDVNITDFNKVTTYTIPTAPNQIDLSNS